MKAQTWYENLPFDRTRWCDESFSVWLKAISGMKILQQEEIWSMWWNSSVWWKIMTVMKIHQSD